MLTACPDCATIQRLAAPQRGMLIECCRCRRVLEHTNGRSLDAALACAVTTTLLLVAENLAILMTVRVAGITRSTHLASGLVTAWRQGWPLIAITLGLLGIVLPLVRFPVLSVTLAAIRLGVRGRWVGTAFRWCEALDLWAMSDVLLIGAGIGYGRIASQIPVQIDLGGWCLVGSAFMTMLTRATLERPAIWRRLEISPPYEGPDAIACPSCDLPLPPRAEGTRCPRCTADVYRRRPSSLTYSAALLLATAVLTPIAYGYPMSEFWEFGRPEPHSIINGVMLLFEHGFWYFGVVIFLVSIVFPLVKMAGLTWFLISIWQRSASRLRRKTQLYRFVDEVGRWSTLDPFTIMIFAPMAQFGQTAHIDFMGGSAAFLATVLLSMAATRCFDPRLMWDAAGSAGKRRVTDAGQVLGAGVSGSAA